MLESEIALAVVALEEGRPADAEREAQAVSRSLGQSTAALRPVADLVTARARLAGHDVAGAERALATARALSMQTERVSLKYELALAESKVDAAAGRGEAARQRLTVLGTSLRKSGLVLSELERRLVVLQIDRAARRGTVQADAAALEKDALAHGAGLIAKRVLAP